MSLRALLIATLCLAGGVPGLWAATWGKVVPIGGHASDLAFDARRNQVYIANFAGLRVDVVAGTDNTLRQPIRVGAPPASLALSPDGQYLVVAHAVPPNTHVSVTIINLDRGGRSELWLPSTPLAVAFGNSPQALIVTTSGLYRLEPASASFWLQPFPKLDCGRGPSPLASFPADLVRASAGVSGDGNVVLVAAEYTPNAPDSPAMGCTLTEPQPGPATLLIRYDVRDGSVSSYGLSASPPLGPRVVSLNEDGSRKLVGWGLFDENHVLLAQFPSAAGEYASGGHAFDLHRNRIYAQLSPAAPATEPAGPILYVMDPDNLAVRERIRIPEKLAGKAVWNADRSILYALSDSGVTVLPVGDLDRAPRAAARQEQVLAAFDPCAGGTLRRTLDIVDGGGAHADFTLSLPRGLLGVRFSQTSGRTPATIDVEIDPRLLGRQSGTAVIPVTIVSEAAINVPDPVRLLINVREPDQRGAAHSVAGRLVDIVSDPVRNRVYLLRQDRNEVVVLDAASFRQIATLKTGNTPTQMTLAANGLYLMVANSNSQVASLFDLNKLAPMPPIVFPPGHYPVSIASARGAMLAVVRNVAEWPNFAVPRPEGMIDRISLFTLTAAPSPALGVYANSVSPDSVLVPSPSRQSIFMASADGSLLLYDDEYGAFVASRKDSESLGGAIAALSDDVFLAGSTLFNRSLVPAGAIPAGTEVAGAIGGSGSVLTVAQAGTPGPGLLQHLVLESGAIQRPVRGVDAPVSVANLAAESVGQAGTRKPPFLRTMATTADGSVVYLSASGITVLPPGFDGPRTAPVIAAVQNMADGGPVAAGGLMRISGTALAGGSGGASSMPLPFSLGEACATVNGMPVPLLSASPDGIEAQMPWEAAGSATVVVTTSGGRSLPFAVEVRSAVPAVFRTGRSGSQTALPLVYRATNNDLVAFSNPVHPKDTLLFIATGLGRTSNQPLAGEASPSDPLAYAVSLPAISIGNTPLNVTFAGLLPGTVGVFQINAEVPWHIPAATQTTLTISQGGTSASFPVRVVSP